MLFDFFIKNFVHIFVLLKNNKRIPILFFFAKITNNEKPNLTNGDHSAICME